MSIEARASAASRLLDDPILMEALANIRLAAVQAWTNTGTADKEQREFAWLTVKVVDRIQSELQSIVDNGLIAAKRVQAPVR